jgi:hypothetical protein
MILIKWRMPGAVTPSSFVTRISGFFELINQFLCEINSNFKEIAIIQMNSFDE